MAPNFSKLKNRPSSRWLKFAWCSTLIPLNTLGLGIILFALLQKGPSGFLPDNYLPAILGSSLVLQLISLVLAVISFFGGLAEKRQTVMLLALFGFLFSAVVGYANFVVLALTCGGGWRC